MPSARIHEAIAKEVNKKFNMNDLLLRIGTVAPDCWRNVTEESGIKDKYLSHFWNFRVKQGQANDYEEFYLKYYNHLCEPFYFGYLIHLIVDQYWKTNIDSRYEIKKNGTKYVKLKDGTLRKDENWFSYFEGLKMQKQIAKIYNLGFFPINSNEINNFECSIDEVNLTGLFGEKGTLSYINKEIMPSTNDEESVIYDNDSIIMAIKETTNFVFKELERLKKLKKEQDIKIKIAIDIDDTILCTKELEEYYWKIFLSKHQEIDANRKYIWGDKELTLFWEEYRELIAFGKTKESVREALQKLQNKGFILDLLSARPLDKYSSLKKKMMDYFDLNGLKYNHLYLGFHSKGQFLKEHNYDILIDNEKRNIDEAKKLGIKTILFNDMNEKYGGLCTNDWNLVPNLIEQIINKKL